MFVHLCPKLFVALRTSLVFDRSKKAYNSFQDEDQESCERLNGAIKSLSSSREAVFCDENIDLDKELRLVGYGPFQRMLTFIVGLCFMADSR